MEDDEIGMIGKVGYGIGITIIGDIFAICLVDDKYDMLRYFFDQSPECVSLYDRSGRIDRIVRFLKLQADIYPYLRAIPKAVCSAVFLYSFYILLFR